MNPKITFDTRVKVDKEAYSYHKSGKPFHNIYLKIETQGAGTDAWTSLILEQCKRVRDLNGVETLSCRTSVSLGMDACELHVVFIPMVGTEGTYICPVPRQLFQAIVVSINEANRMYKKLQKAMREISPYLIKLEESMMCAAKTSKGTKV